MGNISRRTAIALLGSAPTVMRSAQAQQKELAIGMTFPLTGTLALQAGQVRDAVLFAIAEANEKGGVAGYRLQRLSASTTHHRRPASMIRRWQQPMRVSCCRTRLLLRQWGR